MDRQLLHTPEGVRDIYAEECARKLAVQKKIQNVFRLYGYQDIETPVFEFFDIFKKERGSAGTREMYKFFDRENNTLVLRPDITPSIARCVAKYFREETGPLRLCYLGSAFLNTVSYRGRLHETTQTGVELIGDNTSDGDGEMIALVIDALKAAGLQEFQVELGQVDFFRGLVEEAGMDGETQEQLRELIENKNFFGVEELLSRQSMSEEQKQVFLKLPELFGNIEQIRLASTLTSNQRALRAIDRLERVQEILDIYGLGDYVSYDLGMLSKYSYYTGIIFKAYTYGTGEYLVTGGRYDKLLIQFGKDAPAVGFAIVVDQLMLALSRQKIETDVFMVDTIILYEPSARETAILLAGHFRQGNTPVQLIRKPDGKSVTDYVSYARRHGMASVLYLSGSGDEVSEYMVVNGEVVTGNLEKLLIETEGWK
ncbi:ATP phosphoribosyltransferase regulatory subunit [Clostridiaceae bacterium]|nr:ATP phosphoribosyltransferase regulatory subunit [Lachnospiraceae bacterium]NBH17348.1 ATP phosphoribosyltransferase regulatory subunit [Clostridiaceae bacterium]NBH32856.1 ATP phosphoribosyltransferase regulatory subunit [Clostridiaceae bacterium]